MLKIIERSIALQLLVCYILFLLPLFLGGIALYGFEHDAWQKNVQRANTSLSQSITFQVEARLQTLFEEANNLAGTQEAQHLETLPLALTLDRMQHTHPDNSGYIVCDTAGRIKLSYPPNQKIPGEDCRTLDVFQKALANSEPVVTSSLPANASSSLIVPVAVRILNNEKLVGVVIINESFARLAAQLITIRQQVSASHDLNIWILNQNGQALVDTTHSDLAEPPDLKDNFKNHGGNGLIQVQNQDWLYSFFPITGTNWATVVGLPTDTAFAPIMSLQHSLAIALVMLVVGASLFWIVMHGWVVAPLSRLAQAMALIKPDQAGKVTASKGIIKQRQRVDEIGKLTCAFSTMEDEIHRLFRQSDERSQARLHTLDAIMQSTNEGVLLESPEGQIVYANRGFTQFVGIAEQEILLDTFNEHHLPEKLQAMMVDPDAYWEALRRIDQAESPQIVEFQVHGYYNQAGQFISMPRDVRIQLFEVRDREGQLIGRGKIFNDITRHNEAEQVKRNLLAIVSHELRTPLASIKGYATSLLETDVELDKAVQERFLRRIVEEEDRMAELVTSLLEMSQLEAGTLRLSRALYHLNTLLEAIMLANEQRHLCINVAANLPFLYVDRRRMEMVLRNLVENAWRYAGPQATIEIIAQYQSDENAEGIYISVGDDGPGLPTELLERIFDRFYQIESGKG
ncbi:MAG TPA: histidine kinase dimerization/phospho-acceptor domain-containing protein, partial [Ktedonobacteraceae bacterium]|nr:histidine kinase dimerization/phospho-acceptor domain-containing protein [Ktedonobacteraceae bacterium]